MPAPPLRWTKKRKAEILDALARGEVTAAQLEQQHGISAEELDYWRRVFKDFGINGLRVSAIRARRRAGHRQ